MEVSAVEHRRALQEGTGKPDYHWGQETPRKCRTFIEGRAEEGGRLRE